MKKILLVFILIGISTLYVQAQLDADISIPDIPDIPDSVVEPPSTPTAPPATKTAPKPSAPATNTRSWPAQTTQQSQQETSEQNVTVKPEPSKEIGGAPVFNPANDFMEHFQFEALFSSKAWWNYWWAPDMGIMRVTSLPQPIQIPHGILIKWKRDSLGNPMAYLRALVQFPRLVAPDATSKEQPLKAVPVTISQAVIFYQRPGGWMASASPVYVTLQEDDKKLVMVDVNRGEAVWRAWVGHGGIYVENFIGAGLSAARTELNQYFRDEEIRLFTMGNSDVLFYLRPQDALFAKPANK